MKHELQQLPKDRRSLLKLVEAQGWKVEDTKGGHIKITNPDGAFCYASSTPSDFRAIEKMRSDLRKLGLRPYLPLKEDKPLPEPKTVISKVDGDSTTPIKPEAPIMVKNKRKTTPGLRGGALRNLVVEILKSAGPTGMTTAALAAEIVKKFPEANAKTLNSSFQYYAKQGSIKKIGWGIFAAVDPSITVPVSNEDNDIAVLDEVLAVMAKLEGVVKRMKEKAQRIEAAKAALNAIK